MNHTQPVGGPSPSLLRRLSGWLFVLAGFVALASAAAAQTGTITGRVINKGTGGYLSYAQVQVVGLDLTTLTSTGGEFTLNNVPAGEVKLSTNYSGLDVSEVTVTVPAGGTVSQDIELTTSEYGETVQLGKFVVASAREGNAKAIVEQRAALNFKTVIAADAFGDVAEGNVGEFLKLLPGVSVDYVDNDVRSTRIRGLPPKYTTTTMDGLPIANSGSNNSQVNTGRQLELEQISMAALDILETFKTPTSDMMGANLAGNVNAIGKSAFNQQGRSIKYQASLNFNQWYMSLDKSTGWDDKDHSKAMAGGKVEWIDTLLNGRLGVVVSAAHSGAFADQRVVIGTNVFDRNAGNNSSELPLTAAWNFQDGLKPTWRDSILVNFDFKATDDLKLSLRTNYGYYRSEFYNRNWLVNANTTGLTTYNSDGLLTPTTTGNIGQVNRTETSAESLGVTTHSYARVLGSNQRKSGGTLNISPAMNWTRDNMKVDVAANYSAGKTAYTSGQDGFFSLVRADMQRISWRYERVADDDVEITQTGKGVANINQGSIFDLANYTTGGSVEQTRRNSEDRVWAAKADFEIDFADWTMPTKFKVGVSKALEVRQIANLQAAWTMTLTSGPTTDLAVNLADFRDPFGNKVGTITDINGFTSRAPGADKWALSELFEKYGNQDPFSSLANGPFKANAAANLRNLLQNDIDLEEDITSQYVMATMKPLSKLSLVAGLRFERTETQGKGFDDKGIDKTLAVLGVTYTTTVGTTGVAGSRAAVNSANSSRFDYIYYRYGQRTTRENSYNNVLPVLNSRYQITKNLIARGSYFKSLLRPDFQSVIGGVSGTDSSDQTMTTYAINNTTLKPETANNFDIALEYYFEPVGQVSASLFFKDIKNIQVSTPGTAWAGTAEDIRNQVLESGLTEDQANNSGLNRFTSTVNGPKTTLWGFELSYSQELSFLPGAFKGLGVTANFSHYAPEEKRLWALVPNSGDGMALNQGNLILRYRYSKFKAQVSATWTGERLVGNNLQGLTLTSDGEFVPVTTANNTNVVQYQAARWVVSPSLEYQLHRRATIFLNANNIFNSAKFNYTEREVYTARNGNYGASITMGVKGSF